MLNVQEESLGIDQHHIITKENNTLCNTLQNNRLQHTATHCNTLLHTARHHAQRAREIARHGCSLYHNKRQETSFATHCNTSYCDTLQHTAAPCNTLQHAVTRCNTLQHTDAATRCSCNTLQLTATHIAQRAQEIARNRSTLYHSKGHKKRSAIHCNTLQHTTTQHTATHCNPLQPTATHYNTHRL